MTQSQVEYDFPPGHPARFDYAADSPEAQRWRDKHDLSRGEPDFPFGHPKRIDTPGNTNHIPVVPGVDPNNPHMEAFTGRNPEQAAAAAKYAREASERATESVALEPIDAAIANAALEKKRKDLKVEVLTHAQIMEVLGDLQRAQQR